LDMGYNDTIANAAEITTFFSWWTWFRLLGAVVKPREFGDY